MRSRTSSPSPSRIRSPKSLDTIPRWSRWYRVTAKGKVAQPPACDDLLHAIGQTTVHADGHLVHLDRVRSTDASRLGNRDQAQNAVRRGAPGRQVPCRSPGPSATHWPRHQRQVGAARPSLRRGRREIALLLQVGGERPTTHSSWPRRGGRRRRSPSRIWEPIFGSPPLPMTATSSSGLPVTFAASGACALAAGAVTLGAGNCTVTASQGGDSSTPRHPTSRRPSRSSAPRRRSTSAWWPTWRSARSPLQSRPPPALGFPSVLGHRSVLPRRLLVTLAGAGACTLVASQSGSADYEPAPDVAAKLCRRPRQPDHRLRAAAGSDVRRSPVRGGGGGILGAAGRLRGRRQLHHRGRLVTPGTGGGCIVTASQGGNTNYEPAPERGARVHHCRGWPDHHLRRAAQPYLRRSSVHRDGDGVVRAGRPLQRHRRLRAGRRRPVHHGRGQLWCHGFAVRRRQLPAGARRHAGVHHRPGCPDDRVRCAAEPPRSAIRP